MAKKIKKLSPSPLAMWPVVVAILIVAGAVALLFVHLNTQNAAPPPTTTGFWGDHYPSQGHQGHGLGDDKRFAHFRYSSDPPTSGYHREVFAAALISPIAMPKYVQVHLLEHGNILLQYNCMCPDTIAQLTAIAEEYDAKQFAPGAPLTRQEVEAAEESGQMVLVAPYPNMTSTIALTAWTRLATLQSVDKEKIESFINRWLHDQDNLSQ